MNELVKNDQYTYYGYKFSKSECSIINAHVSKPVNNIAEAELLKAIGVSVIKALKTIGQNAKSDEDVQFIASGVYDYVVKQRKILRIDEVILAIELGSLGEFGEDVVHVSVKNVVKWLKEYAQRKINVFKVLSAQKEKTERENALNQAKEKQVEYWENFADNLNAEFMSYKASKKLSNIAWIYVKNLIEIGYNDFLDIDLETKQLMYDQQKEIYIRKKREELKKSYKVIPPSIKIESDDAEIKKLCRLQALAMWFDDQEALDIDKIKALINERSY